MDCSELADICHRSFCWYHYALMTHSWNNLFWKAMRPRPNRRNYDQIKALLLLLLLEK